MLQKRSLMSTGGTTRRLTGWSAQHTVALEGGPAVTCTCVCPIHRTWAAICTPTVPLQQGTAAHCGQTANPDLATWRHQSIRESSGKERFVFPRLQLCGSRGCGCLRMQRAGKASCQEYYWAHQFSDFLHLALKATISYS